MQFEDLKTLSEIRYQREQQVLKSLLVRESALRADLHRLQAHDLQARSVEFEDAAGSRSLGADMLWMKWLSKARSAINFDLARVLAQKEEHLGRVRHAYGKVLVSDALSKQDQASRATKKRQQQLSTVIDRTALK